MPYLSRIFLVCLALLPAVPAGVRAQSLFGGLPVDGIPCESSEGVREHIHTLLQIFDRGRPVQVPALVGIPVTGACLYWLHTHSGNGIIHIESPVVRAFTLGEFFDVWGQELGTTKAAGVDAPHGHTLRFVVNGAAWKGDPRAIPLRDHESIVIQLGPPFATAAKPDWTKI